jgi:hypothetical protein
MRHHRLPSLLLCLAAASGAEAATFTVGPSGSHRSIQSAIDAALSTPGDHEIHVAGGSFVERVWIGMDSGTDRELRLSGGWDDAFRLRTGTSTLDGAGRTPVVGADVRGRSRLSLVGFVVTGGHAPDEVPVGGVSLTVGGAAVVTLADNVIRDNHPARALWIEAAGLNADVGDDGELRVAHNEFSRNRTDSGDISLGGAARIGARGRARVTVAGNRFLDNESRGLNGALGGAILFDVVENARGQFLDNTIVGNRTLSPGGASAALWLVVAQVHGGEERPELTARRNAVLRNAADGYLGRQVELTARGGRLDFTDALIVDGRSGLWAQASGGGRLHLANLTITRHTERGLVSSAFDDGGTIFLSNSILFDNGVELEGEPTQSHNLIGSDPAFVDPAAGLYQLAFASPAIDTGEEFPPGGLGPLDLDRAPRSQGRAVDLGAYETAGSDTDDVVCRPLPFAGQRFDRYAPLCACITDTTLREVHCSLGLPDLFLVLRTPFGWKPGEPVRADWTLHPWTNINGSYAMTSQARIGGQWVPQPPLSPGTGPLSEGQLVQEAFLLALPKSGRTEMRATVRYPLKSNNPKTIHFDVLMPGPFEQPPK